MRKIPVQEALGETLCHDLTAILDNGFKGVKFKRGHIITEEDIPELLKIGKTQIFAWEPGKDELHEDEAALALTEAICGDNLTFQGPSEGKFTVSSEIDGVFRVNSAALQKINGVNDYTVATRMGNCPVSAGEKLAGIRIVPLVTARENTEEVVRIAKENYPVLSVAPYTVKKVGAIITGSEIFNGLIKDAFEPILRKKLQKFGADLSAVAICDDDREMIEKAIGENIRAGMQLVFLTGGMSVDPDDVTPAAIRGSGASLVTQGTPMQPGNMLTIAYINSCALVGVPGASMHSPVTSLDVFLPRMMAGISIKKADISGKGEGGFCMGCGTCTYPICYFGQATLR